MGELEGENTVEAGCKGFGSGNDWNIQNCWTLAASEISRATGTFS